MPQRPTTVEYMRALFLDILQNQTKPYSWGSKTPLSLWKALFRLGLGFYCTIFGFVFLITCYLWPSFLLTLPTDIWMLPLMVNHQHQCKHTSNSTASTGSSKYNFCTHRVLTNNVLSTWATKASRLSKTLSCTSMWLWSN